MLKSLLGSRGSRRAKGWPYKDYTIDYEDEIRGQYADGNVIKDENGNELSLEEALNNIDRPDDSFWKNLLGNNGGSLLSALVGYFTSMAGFTLSGAQREQNQFNAEQSAIQRGWEERMSNTSYQRAVDDMRIAGLNPALMYGNGSSGASTPSGSAASGSSPAPAQLLDLIVQLKSQKLQEKVAKLQSDTSIKTAEIAADATVTSARYSKEGVIYKTDTEKELTEKKLSLAERELSLREYLTTAQVDQINASIDLLHSQTQSEFVRQGLDDAKTKLVHMQTKEIRELLPYRQELLFRQKDVATADYALKMTEKFVQEGLIKGGQIDYLIDKAESEARSAKATADEKEAAVKIKQRLVDIKEGRPISHNGEPLHDASSDVVNRILGDAVQLVDALGSAIVSGLVR